jgi:hypothetical protein
MKRRTYLGIGALLLGAAWLGGSGSKTTGASDLERALKQPETKQLTHSKPRHFQKPSKTKPLKLEEVKRELSDVPPVEYPQTFNPINPPVINTISTWGQVSSIMLSFTDERPTARLVKYFDCEYFQGLCKSKKKDIDVNALNNFPATRVERRERRDRPDGSYIMIEAEDSNPDPLNPQSSTTSYVRRIEYDASGNEKKKWYCGFEGACSDGFERSLTYTSRGIIEREIVGGNTSPNDIISVVVETSAYPADDETCEFIAHELPQGISDQGLFEICDQELIARN